MNKINEALIDNLNMDLPYLMQMIQKNKYNDNQLKEAYEKHVGLNLEWQRHLQLCYDKLPRKDINLLNANTCVIDRFINDNTVWKINKQMIFLAFLRDIKLLSASILSFGQLDHPSVIHACHLYKTWRDGNIVVGDYNNKFILL